MNKIRLLLITAFLLLCGSTAHAGISGWHGSVTFTNGTSNFTVVFSGATYAECEERRTDTKILHSSFAVVSETACIPRFIDIEKYYIPKPKIPFKDPGDCPICGWMIKGMEEVIFPRDYDRVNRLMDKYRIRDYQAVVKELGAQYDLEGFNKEMFELEQEIQQQMNR